MITDETNITSTLTEKNKKIAATIHEYKAVYWYANDDDKRTASARKTSCQG